MSKQKSKAKNTKRRPAWVDMYAKTQKVDARMGDSRDWNTDVPNIKLSRAFVVVLILHVVAVGGILAFEMFKSEPSATKVSAAEGMTQVDADKPAALVNGAGQKAKNPGFLPAVDAVDNDGYLRYTVQSGDSIRFIAETYNISRTELLAANNINERHPLVQGRVLRIPRALLSIPNNAPDGAPLVGNGLAGGLEKDGDSGFIPLKSTGAVVDVPSNPSIPNQSTDSVDRSLTDDGFLPLGNAPETEVPAATVSRVVKKSDRPRVLRERPATTRDAPKRTVLTSASQHTVVSGDTLYGISRKYGVSVNDLLGANPGVTPRSLRIGKTLRIP
ncbi:MAG: LysM peptidoglycan-binding domain-containing protein [Verrucomicrobiota bacterium]|nr:LysM peptidoglycan-binding domain-containing protein [Verrucomicrobiota bacterium]